MSGDSVGDFMRQHMEAERRSTEGEEQRRRTAEARKAGSPVERLGELLRSAQDRLGTNEELQVTCQLPSGESMTVTRYASSSPDLVLLGGVDAQGRSCQLVAHVSTVRLLMSRAPVSGYERVKRIVFAIDDDTVVF
jgi:hypothetical protein